MSLNNLLKSKNAIPADPRIPKTITALNTFLLPRFIASEFCIGCNYQDSSFINIVKLKLQFIVAGAPLSREDSINVLPEVPYKPCQVEIIIVRVCIQLSLEALDSHLLFCLVFMAFVDPDQKLPLPDRAPEPWFCGTAKVAHHLTELGLDTYNFPINGKLHYLESVITFETRTYSCQVGFEGILSYIH